ncbi:hypothetical protein [Staphylococcus cohnii]|uniref:hypothetical protein n=1 Tax=Staphylococcus cohnii TaxID=29382 RepID=UPI001865F530|nr:hypothetical protein [Staphylococcus cohnii]
MPTYSTIDKKEKLKWLDDKSNMATLSELQIQKFLFFTEMFNRNTGEKFNLNSLKAYENGPVFSDVYGDVRYDKSQLLSEIASLNPKFQDKELSNLKSALFLTKVHNDKELSELTHILDLWQSKKDRIEKNEPQIPIYESDITVKDQKLVDEMLKSTVNKNIDEYKVIKIEDKIFLIKLDELELLKEDHNQTLELLSQNSELINPVYITFEEGVMLID